MPNRTTTENSDAERKARPRKTIGTKWAVRFATARSRVDLRGLVAVASALATIAQDARCGGGGPGAPPRAREGGGRPGGGYHHRSWTIALKRAGSSRWGAPFRSTC